eukprot:TRINITY_DN963_c0_g1_i4.p3 TRINITY_DN963_c0_g1~~TRINITY_DN963_c0_g1_i4.p3  ORF type:complete len:132 (-),score=18.56 TRINITY_DN963_c0_g1_i4:36-431(-)
MQDMMLFSISSFSQEDSSSFKLSLSMSNPSPSFPQPSLTTKPTPTPSPSPQKPINHLHSLPTPSHLPQSPNQLSSPPTSESSKLTFFFSNRSVLSYTTIIHSLSVTNHPPTPSHPPIHPSTLRISFLRNAI